MIVVDASVVISVIAESGPRAAAAQQRLDGDEIVAPELIDLEVTNGLRGLVLGGRLTELQARKGLIAFLGAPVERVSHAGLVRRVWELRDNLSAYNASYVAVAEILGVALVTRDAGIARAPGVRCAVELLT